jgi:hypothetical protein
MDVQEPVGRDAPGAKGKGTGARKRVGVKTPVENAKRSLNLRVDDDSYRRLNIHALMRDKTVSELVMEFAQGLREYSMPHRLGGKAEPGE